MSEHKLMASIRNATTENVLMLCKIHEQLVREKIPAEGEELKCMTSAEIKWLNRQIWKWLKIITNCADWRMWTYSRDDFQRLENHNLWMFLSGFTFHYTSEHTFIKLQAPLHIEVQHRFPVRQPHEALVKYNQLNQALCLPITNELNLYVNELIIKVKSRALGWFWWIWRKISDLYYKWGLYDDRDSARPECQC